MPTLLFGIESSLWEKFNEMFMHFGRWTAIIGMGVIRILIFILHNGNSKGLG